jgi:hypothetical protein
MAENKFNNEDNAPPPLFTGLKERNFVKQVIDEELEHVIGQALMYYPIDLSITNFHPLYGEAIEKSFLPPIRVYAQIDFDETESKTTSAGTDRKTKITVYFHHRRLTEDQELYVKEGDFIFYNKEFHEIYKVREPERVFDQIDYKMSIVAECGKAREGTFKYNKDINK